MKSLAISGKFALSVLAGGAAVAVTSGAFVYAANSSNGAGTAAAAAPTATKAAPGQDKKTPTPTPTAAGNKALTVSANPATISDLVLGQSVPVTLTIGNPNNQDVVLQSVSVSITGPSPTPAVGFPCNAPDDFQVTLTSVTPVDLLKQSSTTVPAVVTLNNSTTRNQDGCRSKTFNFVFTATATSK